MHDEKTVSKTTLQRLPLYANYLRSLAEDTGYISSVDIAAGLGLNPVLVRKDLAAIGSVGRPRTGYETRGLIAHLESYLNGGNRHAAVLVGLGHLGRALAAYPGFRDYGVEIVALFDKNRDVVGEVLSGYTIQDIGGLATVCRRLGAYVGIITVPDSEAQSVCDQLVEGNVEVVWNFTAVHLVVPGHLRVLNEDIAASLVLL